MKLSDEVPPQKIAIELFVRELVGSSRLMEGKNVSQLLFSPETMCAVFSLTLSSSACAPVQIWG